MQTLVNFDDEQNGAIFWKEPDTLVERRIRWGEPWGVPFPMFAAFRWKDVELHDQCIAIFFAFVSEN